MAVIGAVYRWLRRHPILIAYVIVVAGNFMAWRAIEAEAEAREKNQCEAGAETRQILRDMSYDVGVASGVAGGEALIQSVGDADQATIDAYRANLVDQLDPALTQIIERLPDRRWVDGECVDVPVGE